jgi:flagellin-like protein
MRKIQSKKNVSPVVATALLIGMTISLAVIVFLWARGFIVEQIEKFGQSAEQVCEELDFKAEIAPAGGAVGGGNLYDLYITNRGNVPIYAIDIKKIGHGKSEVDRRTISMVEGMSVKESVTIERKSYDQIIILPVLLGNIKGTANKKAYPCPIQYGHTLSLPL